MAGKKAKAKQWQEKSPLGGRNLDQDLAHKEDLPAEGQPVKERKEKGDRTERG